MWEGCWQAREGETPNDRNDRAIRFASKWFQIQMEGSREVYPKP